MVLFRLLGESKKMIQRIAWNKGLTKKEYPKISNSGVKKGNKPYNYIDGSSKNRKYTKKKWINFAKQIFERDNWTCQDCSKQGGQLNAHHILPWAGNPNLIFDKDNIITLCVSCHTKLHQEMKR